MITGIGSLPFTDVDEAIDLIFNKCPEIPFWPQLPRRSKLENMYVPFLDGVPFFYIDDIGNVYPRVDDGEDWEEFLIHLTEEKVQSFAIRKELIPGFYRLLERIEEIESSVKAVKTQITGPISMAMGIKDKRGLPIIYDDFFFGILKKTINMKARWMVFEIKNRLPSKEVILFFDEPYLVAYGSSYLSLPQDQLISALNEAFYQIDAKIGIHCCGNTDWSLVLRSNADIINYDAYNFLENIFLFREDLERFLERKGTISPGIVPSTDDIKEITQEKIKEILCRFLDEFSKIKPFEKELNILITPSCGLGNLSSEDAKKAMALLANVPKILSEIFDKQ
ncbi:MAG: hypothetical protein NZ583_02490 [Desulfobacterota bacterium]|nr:hypothetical protein [Thermodesulfobacteriota bacterium]MDW8001753.1 hypothetical protein [Deltaproteobacteria bacterium]